MKATSLLQLAAERRLTINRAAMEILCAAGYEERIYPTKIRKQNIPDRLLKQACWHQIRKAQWDGYSPLNGPKRPLP